MDHYTIALNLNPRNLPAQEGLQKLEQSTDTGLSGAGGGGGGGAGGGASSTAAGSAASERTYDIDMDGTSGDGGNALVFFTDLGFISLIYITIVDKFATLQTRSLKNKNVHFCESIHMIN